MIDRQIEEFISKYERVHRLVAGVDLKPGFWDGLVASKLKSDFQLVNAILGVIERNLASETGGAA